MMKPTLLIALLLLAVATAGAIPPGDAPVITRQIAKLKTLVTTEVASGKLSKDDGDKFTARITAIEKQVADATSLSQAERKNMRGQLAGIAKELGSNDQSDASDNNFFGKPAASPSH